MKKADRKTKRPSKKSTTMLNNVVIFSSKKKNEEFLSQEGLQSLKESFERFRRML